jgi:hypothetical protein
MKRFCNSFGVGPPAVAVLGWLLLCSPVAAQCSRGGGSEGGGRMTASATTTGAATTSVGTVSTATSVSPAVVAAAAMQQAQVQASIRQRQQAMQYRAYVAARQQRIEQLRRATLAKQEARTQQQFAKNTAKGKTKGTPPADSSSPEMLAKWEGRSLASLSP